MVALILSFEVIFHGPFRVATGNAKPGFDDSVDVDNLLPASSLKGLMRHSAHRFFPDATKYVFGDKGVPSPWAWTNAVFDTDPLIKPRVRIEINGTTASDQALVSQQEAWASTARFEIEQMLPLAGGNLSKHHHQLVLETAARATHWLGADRRRGLGWVTIQPVNGLDIDELVANATSQPRLGQIDEMSHGRQQ